jgi:hypothetical protein
MSAQTITTATPTTPVFTKSSRLEDHETFFISAMTSSQNRFGLNPDSDCTADAFSSAKLNSHPHNPAPSKSFLLRLFMRRMLFAEFAVFVEFQTIRVVLLVLIGLIIAVFANRAGQSNCVTHPMHSFTSLRISRLESTGALTVRLFLRTK